MVAFFQDHHLKELEPKSTKISADILHNIDSMINFKIYP